MGATSLFNCRTSDFETVESFSKRLYETARRYNKSLIFTASESRHVVYILSRYYKESYSNILSVIRNIELSTPSKKYRIQWVKCLGEQYLVIDKR